MKKNIFTKSLLIGIGIFMLPVSVLAYNKTQKNIHVTETETIDHNYYAAGEEITIDGNIHGDLIAAAGMITVNGDIAGDIIIAGGQLELNGSVGGSILASGGQITINGNVGQNIRVAGGQIYINAPVEKSVLAVGGTVSLLDDAYIGWTLTTASGATNIKGTVNGNVDTTSGQLIINGSIKGNVDATIGEMLSIQKDGYVQGNFSYKSVEKKSFDETKIAGKVRFEKNILKQQDSGKYFTAVATSFWFIGVISMIIIGLILTTKCKTMIVDTVKSFWIKPGRHIGYGLLHIIITPIIVILLLITIVGAPLGLLWLGIYFILMYIGCLFASIAIGAKILNKVKKTSGNDSKKKAGKDTVKTLAGSMILGVIVVSLVSAIPFFGWIIHLVLAAWGYHVCIDVAQEYKKRLFD